MNIHRHSLIPTDSFCWNNNEGHSVWNDWFLSFDWSNRFNSYSVLWNRQVGVAEPWAGSLPVRFILASPTVDEDNI